MDFTVENKVSLASSYISVSRTTKKRRAHSVFPHVIVSWWKKEKPLPWLSVYLRFRAVPHLFFYSYTQTSGCAFCLELTYRVATPAFQEQSEAPPQAHLPSSQGTT